MFRYIVRVVRYVRYVGYRRRRSFFELMRLPAPMQGTAYFAFRRPKLFLAHSTSSPVARARYMSLYVSVSGRARARVKVRKITAFWRAEYLA
jgi:hypothetical protein